MFQFILKRDSFFNVKFWSYCFSIKKNTIQQCPQCFHAQYRSTPSACSQGNDTSKGYNTVEGQGNISGEPSVSHVVDGLSESLPTAQKLTAAQAKPPPALGSMGTTQPAFFCNTAKPAHPLLGTGLYSTI